MKKISIILFLAIIIFSGCTKSNPLTFTSTIESTQVDVNSEVSGKVDKVNFDEGASVKKNDILVVLDSSSAKLQVEQAKDAVDAAQAKLDELKAGSRSEQINQAKAAMNAAKANLAQVKSGSRSEQIRQAQASVQQAQDTAVTAQKNYDYKLKNLENAKELLTVNGSSQQQLDDLSNLVDVAYQQLKSSHEQSNIANAQLDLLVSGAAPEAIRASEATYQQVKAQYELVKNGPTSQSVTIAQKGVDQAQGSLNLAKLQLDKFNVKAPIDGQLLYKTVDVGGVVFPGSNIATISEPNDLWLKFYVPETQKHKVAVGKVLTLYSKAYPNEKIQGKITFVSDKAEFTPKNVETAEAKESTVFEVKVKIINLLDKLKPGMTMNVTIS